MDDCTFSQVKIASFVIPIYRNEENLPQLVESLVAIKSKLGVQIEAVFVVDGSPDNSWNWLTTNEVLLNEFRCHFILLSRNFGALSAVRRGLRQAQDDAICVFAADGQEPVDLLIQMAEEVLNGHEVVVGIREDRTDPFVTKTLSLLFWKVFRLVGGREFPRRGVDVFAISRRVSATLLELMESSTSLVGLIYWAGFDRKEIPYVRKKRLVGKSSWTFRKRAKYALDSITSFSEAPLIVLIVLGLFGFVASTLFGLYVLLNQVVRSSSPPGYTPLLMGIAIVASTQLLSSGVLGMYLWRVSENVRRRPVTVDWKTVQSIPETESNPTTSKVFE